MPATVDLNRVKHMARVLLEKYCEICLLHPSRNDIRVVVMLVGDFVGLEWIDIVHEIYIMEKLSFSLRVQNEKVYRIWTKWTEYVKPVRSDFI